MRIMLCLVAAGIVFGAAGCAWVKEENRRTLNVADELVRPQEPVTQVAMAPVFVPVGTALLATDILVVHPLAMLPEAMEDTHDWLWDSMGQSGSVFREALLVVPRTVATPFVLVGDWAVRSVFPID
jgi:Flp pilus assembly protein CpaB